MSWAWAVSNAVRLLPNASADVSLAFGGDQRGQTALGFDQLRTGLIQLRLFLLAGKFKKPHPGAPAGHL